MATANAVFCVVGSDAMYGKGTEGIAKQSLHALSMLLHQQVLPERLLEPFMLCADAFNKWEAGQRLAKKLLVKLYQAATTSDKACSFYRSQLCPAPCKLH